LYVGELSAVKAPGLRLRDQVSREGPLGRVQHDRTAEPPVSASAGSAMFMRSPGSVDQLLGTANGLGHSKAGARQDPADGCGKRNAVTDGHVQRADVVARPNNSPHATTFQDKRNPIAAPCARLIVVPYQARLRTADARPI
jgi:hypothetical protein